MPLLETKGAGSAQGFGLSLGGEEAVYIEDVFSTYLYTGTGATQTITNGIDLAGEGGLVWGKHREFAVDHAWYDTERGINQRIGSSTTQAETTIANTITSFNSDGVTLGTGNSLNESGRKIALWTFRKQPKFFDVVTYTGNGSNRTIAHDLGSVPGCIIVKKTSGADNWFVQHRSLGATKYIALNDADIAYTNSQIWNNTEPTSTVFTLGTNSGVNQSGGTYVAYLFAHDAGGFGLTGLDNVVSCGSYTYAGGANPVITLGWEPQWLLRKRSDSTGNWELVDNMRGLPVLTSSPQPSLQPNLSAAESSASMYLLPNATGFQDANAATGATYIYIAIRRGPMKVPTSGTEVFAIDSLGGTSPNPPGFNGVLVDLAWKRTKNASDDWYSQSRLTGTNELKLNTRGAATNPSDVQFYYQDGWNTSSSTLSSLLSWMFRRAPGFFDVVCYTGTGSARTINHNLAAVPELMIIKQRNASGQSWLVYHTGLTSASYEIKLNFAFTESSSTAFNGTAPTSSVFSVGGGAGTNGSGSTYVAYLFATLAGVSKVGSYTGTGTTQVINCGFTAGSRFVMIKRTDSTGDWYVWDSARGITAGNDPYLLLNSTAAEVTSTDYVDTAATGFEISSTAPAAINASGGTFIFLAIA